VDQQTLQYLALLIPGLPLIGFLIHVLIGDRIPKSLAGVHASSWPILSFIITLVLFGYVKASSLEFTLFEWFKVGEVRIPFGFLVDRLSICMLLIISGIGALIHIYSIGYMHEDKGFNKFFSYLNLFIFFMMILVMGNNFVLMFVGWEGVGLCSYLLIGFWFSNNAYNDAARKAFVMNRIGDFALIFGLVLIATNFGTLTFTNLFNEDIITKAPSTLILWISVFLFIGATGKSAQIPLFTWLPDAMAGPTPVSALIHAATMVTAGIYLIVRSNILYTLAPETLQLILVVGLLTSIVAGTIACKQNDIKKVLAYSTVSQLGLMFFAIGLGAYEAAFFHLLTHAFFKALLFLGAGSVIHGMGGEQDIRNMGGLRNTMKWTHILFLIGVLAIIALPPFAGFFSKDNILSAAFANSPIWWAVGLISGLITVFYMTRMYYLVFWGDSRATEKVKSHIHESPLSMILPMGVLAILSIIGGFMNVPEIFHGNKGLMNFLSPILPIAHGGHLSHGTEYMLMGISLLAILTIAFFTYRFYVVKSNVPMGANPENSIADLWQNKYYLDEIYDSVIGKPTSALANFFDNTAENRIIDTGTSGLTKRTGELSDWIRKAQSGQTSHYLIAMALGMSLFLLYFIFFR
jgi:NADH-quinone oxidoreductase subunit L